MGILVHRIELLIWKLKTTFFSRSFLSLNYDWRPAPGSSSSDCSDASRKSWPRGRGFISRWSLHSRHLSSSYRILTKVPSVASVIFFWKKNRLKKKMIFEKKCQLVPSKKFSLFDPAVWPAIADIYIYERRALLYRRYVLIIDLSLFDKFWFSNSYIFAIQWRNS